MACAAYTQGRREQILTTLLQSDCPLPFAVLLKLLAYEARLELEVPLRRLVQDAQVIESFPTDQLAYNAHYELSAEGCRAARACARVFGSGKSKKRHIECLLDRDALFKFDVALAQCVVHFQDETIFCTSTFHERFRTTSAEVLQRGNSPRERGVRGSFSYALDLARDDRAHRNRRNDRVYAHALLKALYVRGVLSLLNAPMWVRTCTSDSGRKKTELSAGAQ